MKQQVDLDPTGLRSSSTHRRLWVQKAPGCRRPLGAEGPWVQKAPGLTSSPPPPPLPERGLNPPAGTFGQGSRAAKVSNVKGGVCVGIELTEGTRTGPGTTKALDQGLQGLDQDYQGLDQDYQGTGPGTTKALDQGLQGLDQGLPRHWTRGYKAWTRTTKAWTRDYQGTGPGATRPGPGLPRPGPGHHGEGGEVYLRCTKSPTAGGYF
ncbi:unnamed protein product [Boreogadus saida]